MSRRTKTIPSAVFILCLLTATEVFAAPVLWPVSKVTFSGASGAWIEHSGTVGATAVEVDLKFDSTTQVAELVKTLEVSFKRHALRIVDPETVRVTFDGQIQGTPVIRYFDPNATSSRSYSIDLDLDQDGKDLADATRISEVITYHNNTRYSWGTSVSIFDVDAMPAAPATTGPVPERQFVSVVKSETVVAGLITQRSIDSDRIAEGNGLHPTRTIDLKQGWPGSLTHAGRIVFRDSNGHLFTEEASRFAAVTSSEKYLLPNDLLVAVVIKQQDGIERGRRGIGFLEYDKGKQTSYSVSNSHSFDINIDIEHKCSSGYTVTAPGPCGPDNILPLPIKVTAASRQIANVTEESNERLELRINDTRNTLSDSEEIERQLEELSKQLVGTHASLSPFTRLVADTQVKVSRLIEGLRKTECIRTRMDERKLFIAETNRPPNKTFLNHLKDIDRKLKTIEKKQLPALNKLRAALIESYDDFVGPRSKGVSVKDAVDDIAQFACRSKIDACDCRNTK